MNASILIFVVILLGSVYRGYKSGFIMVFARFVSLAAGYLSAWWLTLPLGKLVQQTGILDGIMTYLASGMVVFMLTYWLLTFIFSMIHKNLVGNEEQIPPASAIGGALLGSVIGLIFATLAVWFMTTLNTTLALKSNKQPELDQLQEKVSDLVQSSIRKVAIDGKKPSLETLPAVLIANPSENILHAQLIVDQGLFQNLVNDQEAISALNRLAPAELVQLKSFKRLVSDPNVQAIAQQMNFSSDPVAFEKALAMQFTVTWAKVQAVQESVEFQQLISDPEIKQLMNERNIFKLMNNRKIESFMRKINDVETPQIEWRPNEVSESKRQNQSSSTIYRWVDENGKVHYSDKPQPKKN